MNHFNQIDPDIQEFILDRYLVINLKIDLISFNVRVNEDKTLSYFGREGKELTTAKLITVNFYDQAISYFEKKKDLLINNPNFIGKTFFMEFWVDGSKNLRKPKVKPKNGFILSYAKHERVIPPNNPVLFNFAETVGIDPPPIVWEGFLNKEQKELLLNLAYTFEYNEDDLQQLSVLFPKFDKLYKKFNFEGLVIYYEEDKDWKTVKIVDPKYTEDIKKKIENDKKIQMTNFDILKDVFTKESLQKIIINIETSFGEKDITNDIKWKIIEIIFNYYSTKHEKVIKMLELEPKFFDVSINLVSPQIEEKIKNNVYYREFFSLIFRMFTNKNYSNYLKRIGFSTEVIDKISYIVERYDLASIEPYIEEPEKKKKTTRKQKVQKDKSPFKGKEPEEFDTEEKEEEEKEEEEGEPVSLLVGRFQPPHIGHLNAINKFASYTPVICIVDTGRRTERSPFDSDDIEVIFRHFIKDGLLPKDTKIIKHYNGNIPEIINKYNLNVKEVLAGDDRIEGYKNQFPDDADINFVKTIRYFKGTDIRNWLNKGEIEKLKKAVPEGYLDMYFELFGGINTKEIEKGKKKEPILVGR